MPPRVVKALDIWMNGHRVGRWDRGGAGADRLTYDSAWIAASSGRPLSLSLPVTFGHGPSAPVPIRGDVVTSYFDNLIPDNERILQRMRERYGTRSTTAFDLLSAVGRDCAGAVQLVPAGEAPNDVKVIECQPLDEAGVAQLLRDLPATDRWTREETEAFRLSIAGAQEKTALLLHEGNWCIPQRSTPSTHIFKLPLGRVANMQADMKDSVEIEWLCMQLAGALGLPVANTEIGCFEDQKALIVERFDRKLSSDGTWWQRIPQEDFCQVFGLPPTLKYEADGGPGIQGIMDRLQGSERPEQDRATFFRAQIVFWLMGATDGHAKNFSIHLMPGGCYQLTPLYDILSTYPVQGTGANHLDSRRAKLAMAVRSKHAHYLLHDIHRWHWISMAEKLGLQGAGKMIDELVHQVPEAMDSLSDRLPAGFPSYVFETINTGMTEAAKRIAREPDRRS
ncbi:type II toxin-antitoxin system HipA family toxin [Oleiagrimonas sp.]|jgi:serine/threonine-protein kinase HipA|uniref:type II toxin-antitoxin system HipA family toxin n=1 Tax=Oleiagrimonas sp. TaxID=2010330 RepID=UPI002605BA9E|nr:type II toxin-antitoxin system HipA family toxin [Oleiagrimonas sp.]MDA3915291.1 type II toxin-antitoxin system HipA family toxin [Oleiagrimonas sp.]